jgi:small-conductance mechanosensitive channel
MDLTSLTDIMAAQRAYATARSQALAAARAPGADPKAAVRSQHQAMLQYLQARVSVLTTARAKAQAQSDAELANYQQKIGQIQQLLVEDTPATAPTTAPTTIPAGSTPTGPGSPGNTPAPVSAQAAPKEASHGDPKKGG